MTIWYEEAGPGDPMLPAASGAADAGRRDGQGEAPAGHPPAFGRP